MQDSMGRVVMTCLVFSMFGVASPALAQCVYQPDPGEVDDASINAYYPSRDLNHPETLAAATSDGFQGQMRGFIRFPDLSSLPYPASSMKLQLYGLPRDPYTPKRGDVSAYQVLQDWGETTVTYNNQPAHHPVPIGTVSPDTDRWYEWDITGLYNAWRSGALPNFGLKLISSHQSVRATGINFIPSDQPDPTLRPRLVSADPCGLVVAAAIDVKPGSDPNAVNPRSKGKIPVAILTTSTADGDPFEFDAWDADPLSLAFGPDGAGIAHAYGHAEDVDRDGDLDMVVHFKTRETGIACGDTEATLAGETFGGQPIEGTDSIRTVGCK